MTEPALIAPALIALGANLGDPLTALRQAKAVLADLGSVTATPGCTVRGRWAAPSVSPIT